MDWKTLDSLIQDHYSTLSPTQVETVSKELLEALNDKNTKPLQALKVAYILTLLQLKLSEPDKAKAAQFTRHFETILQHEIETTEMNPAEQAPAHLLYVRKLAEHYLHHLMMVAELSDSKLVMKKLQTIRLKNHQALLNAQGSGAGLWEKEQRHIAGYFRKHYLFFGLLLTFALYFSWTSFWHLSDFAMNQWVYSEFDISSVSFMIRDSLLLIFSASMIWAFIGYQKDISAEEKN
jgi:hypothetical protein